MDYTNLYGHCKSQPLTYDEIEMWHGHSDHYLKKLKKISTIIDDSDIGFSVEVDLRYPDKIKEKTKIFPIYPENKVIPKHEFRDYMKK